MSVFYILLLFTLTRGVVINDSGNSLKESKEIVSALLKDQSDIKTAEELQNAAVIKEDKAAVNLLKTKKTDLIGIFNGENFDARDGANIASAVATGLKGGLPDLVRGFKTKNWYYMTVGTLNILTALTVVVGGPYGAIAAAILSIITAVLKIFGEPASESQEAMFTRVLTDFQVANLYTEVMGVKMYYETLQSSVKNFRENPTNLTMAEATTVYALSFNDLNIFGKLQEKIEDFCFTGPVTDATREEKDKNVKRCFKMLKGYLKLTALRQLLLAEMAGMCQEAVTQQAKHREGFEKISTNFLHLIKQDHNLDTNVLQFLTTPMEKVSARYTIFKLYSAPEDNKEVIAYIKRLDVIQEADSTSIDRLFDRKHIMLCSNEQLQGMCQLVLKGYRMGEVAVVKDWGNTESIFIPPGLMVRGKVEKETRVGPFRGLGVYSSSDKLVKLHDIQVIENESDFEQARICTIKEWCDNLDQVDAFQDLGEGSNHGFKLSQIKSVWIPTGYMALLSNKDMVAGPIYGGVGIKDISRESWDEIRIRKSPDKSETDVVTVCEKEKFEGYCQQLSEEFFKDEPVKFAGLKQEFPISGKATIKKSLYSVKKILSMKIPAGFEVNLYASKYEKSAVPVKTGPYIGPLEISQLEDDGIDMVNVKKITKKGNVNKRHKVHKHNKINFE